MQIDPRLEQIVRSQPYPLMFVTISGAHLYGFASPDSDYDVRGAHILPAREVMGLDQPRETIERSCDPAAGDLDVDLVTHDVKKFMQLMLKKDGYVLEQLYSPLVVHTTPEHQELRAIGRGCVTRFHHHHYLGFAETQWKLFLKEQPPRVKPLLYVYRTLLTGIHLMRTGEVESNLVRLNEEFALPWIDDLIARKVQGPEADTFDSADVAFHTRQYEILVRQLEQAGQASSLPIQATTRQAMNDLLVRVRLGTS